MSRISSEEFRALRARFNRLGGARREASPVSEASPVRGASPVSEARAPADATPPADAACA